VLARKLRLRRGWSQEQLAQMSGLSVRTVQRIERNQGGSVESLKSLAAVFEVEFTSLIRENEMSNETNKISADEEIAMQQVKEIKGFYTHLVQFFVIVSALAFINHMTSPGHYWVIWVIVGWGAGVVAHGLTAFEVFSIFSASWEKKQIEKRINRKL
jgi:transcriptional regulator with XRE-family HTH domain|tara:strand:+ start:221 stop:691 length:471 start_codon:yes stop_codon:yes gene_type:complete